jgi:hypothetical protein
MATKPKAKEKDGTEIAPLELTQEEKDAQLEEYRKQIEALQVQNAELTAQMSAKPGTVSGWLVTTPRTNYSGVTAGVAFARGRAFIPDSDPGVKDKVRILTSDYGYSAEHKDAGEVTKLRAENQQVENSLRAEIAEQMGT